METRLLVAYGLLTLMAMGALLLVFRLTRRRRAQGRARRLRRGRHAAARASAALD